MWGWIVLGVFALLIIFILSIRVTFTVKYDKTWTTKIKIFAFEKDIDVNKILKGVLFPPEPVKKEERAPKEEEKKEPAKKKDPMDAIKRIYEKDGIAGIIEFVQIIMETLSVAVTVFFRHFIIDVLDVEIVVANEDASLTAREYGRICGAYYPFIGVIRNGMKVKKYNENIRTDFLVLEGYEKLFFKGSISVMNLLGIVLAGAKTFLVNLRNSKK